MGSTEKEAPCKAWPRNPLSPPDPPIALVNLMWALVRAGEKNREERCSRGLAARCTEVRVVDFLWRVLS